MRRFALTLPLVLSLLAARPAPAAVINLSSDYIVDPGHVEVLTFGYYSPFELKVLASATYAANPVGSGYHWAEMYNSLEAGLLPDTSMTVVAPLDFYQHFDGTGKAAGLTDMTLGLSRRLWQNDRGSWKTRFRVGLATGNVDQGLGSGVPAIGLDNAVSQTILPGFLIGTLNLNYLYSLRSVRSAVATDLPITSWRGHRIQINGSLEMLPMPNLGTIVEVLGQYDSHAEADRQGVPETGDLIIQIAPGFTYTFSPNVALQGSVIVPVYRGGYEDSYRFQGAVGLILDF